MPTSTFSDPYMTTLLGKISEGKRLLSIAKGERIFSQGDQANSVYFVQTGRVKVSVISFTGKEAVIAIQGPRGLLGEESLLAQSPRTVSATAIEASTVVQVETRAMLRALRDQPELSETFMTFLLKRKVDLEGDLCDQLFNHSEKRLARLLLKLTNPTECEGIPDLELSTLSQETLAEMVGTTRSRISYFMNKFRRQGLIEYDGYHGHLKVKKDILTEVVLQD